MKNYMMLALLVAAMGLTACGKQGDKGDTGAPGPTGPAAPVTPAPVVDEVQEDINAVLEDENDYRLRLGQTMLSEGLSCQVVQVASGQCLSSGSTAAGCNPGNVIKTTGSTYTYLYKGLFNQDSTPGNTTTELLPAQLRPLFVNKNFRIICTGQIVVLETNYYDFSLNSDDGSILTIAGSQVINNDNNHGMVLKTGSKFLRRGVHTFRLDYAQTGSGSYGLILQAGGASIDGKYYAH